MSNNDATPTGDEPPWDGPTIRALGNIPRRYVYREAHDVFYVNDLPWVDEPGGGFSLYRGVLICWAAEADPVAFDIIDMVIAGEENDPAAQQLNIKAINVSQRRIGLLWGNVRPPRYSVGKVLSFTCGDYEVVISAVLE